MNCKACRIEIEESDVAKPLSQAASNHLESCTQCTVMLEEHVALRGMIGGLEVVTAPADFDFRLRARLAGLKSEERDRGFWTRFAPSTRALAIAASVVVVISVGLLVRQASLGPSMENPAEGIAKVVPIKPDALSVPPENRNPTDNTRDIPAVTPAIPLNDGAATAVSRSNNRSVRKRKGVGAEFTRDEGIDSMDLSSSPPAGTLLPPGIPDPMTLSSSTVAVSVRASTQPTTIALRDTAARRQTISIRPVTYGGQDSFERENSKLLIMPTVQGIW